MPRKFKLSALTAAILALLHESPMHPYQMQRLIKERNKDQVINVEQRASIYQAINQLLRAGLIAVLETSREEGFPERTVYQLTEAGHQAVVNWLREMLSTPAREYPQFPAAVSLLPLLTPEDVIHQLEIRAETLRRRISGIDAEMRLFSVLPRLFLLESEYIRAVLEAELKWVRGVIADLRDGQLTWNHDWMQPYWSPDTEA